MRNMTRSAGGMLIALSLAMAAMSSAGAAPVGGIKPQPPQPRWGTWEATVRWIEPHTVPGPNGPLVYTFKYAHISAATQGDCETQLYGYASQPGVTVTEFCTFHSF
ncbi:hypothetical protein [Pseudomonas sp. CGJS7]|uniref:hypothetical protein n=1 Tax=Pseudomonas sp. CGJS7 TaxID=3109348 RepID=UPI00300BAFCC